MTNIAPGIVRLFVLLTCFTAARADIITFGYIQMASGNPADGLLTFLVSNVSGPSVCDASFNSCTSLFIDQGHLTVEYTDLNLGAQVYSANLPDGFGPGDLDSTSFSDFTVDPASWTIGRVTFSGVLSPVDLFAFSGDPLTIGSTAFSASFLASETTFALLRAEASPAISGVPEPSLFVMTGIAVLLTIVKRRN